MPGVRHLHRVTGTPWDIHVVTIDLVNGRIGLRVGIKNDNSQPDGGETVRSICQRYGAVVGINCDYFAPSVDPYQDHRHIPQGYCYTDGLAMLAPGHDSPIVADRTAMAIPAGNAWVTINRFWAPETWWYNVCAGGPRIIRNGTVNWEREPDIPDQTSRQPRTGAAVSQDWHTLILATVDGRQSSSAGMTSNELGNLLKEFGGYQGMGFDSGGSTTMVINGVTANHPSDGSDRLIANCLMVLDRFRSLPAAKNCADGTDVYVDGLIVTGVFNGFIYAQKPDRSLGIRIVTNASLSEGVEIWARGTLATVDGERRINATRVEVVPSPP